MHIYIYTHRSNIRNLDSSVADGQCQECLKGASCDFCHLEHSKLPSLDGLQRRTLSSLSQSQLLPLLIAPLRAKVKKSWRWWVVNFFWSGQEVLKNEDDIIESNTYWGLSSCMNWEGLTSQPWDISMGYEWWIQWFFAMTWSKNLPSFQTKRRFARIHIWHQISLTDGQMWWGSTSLGNRMVKSWWPCQRYPKIMVLEELSAIYPITNITMENHYGKSPFFSDMSLWKITMFKTPPGKRLHNYGKSPFWMGKSTISMTIFNSKLNKLPKGSFRINTWPQQKPGHQSRGPSFQFQHHFYGAFCEILQV